MWVCWLQVCACGRVWKWGCLRSIRSCCREVASAGLIPGGPGGWLEGGSATYVVHHPGAPLTWTSHMDLVCFQPAPQSVPLSSPPPFSCRSGLAQLLLALGAQVRESRSGLHHYCIYRVWRPSGWVATFSNACVLSMLISVWRPCVHPPMVSGLPLTFPTAFFTLLLHLRAGGRRCRSRWPCSAGPASRGAMSTTSSPCRRPAWSRCDIYFGMRKRLRVRALFTVDRPRTSTGRVC